jgi:putative peptide zinc metalloprotease protein
MTTDLQGFSGFSEPIAIDTSEQRRSYLLVGGDGRHLQLSPSAYYILRGVYEGLTWEQLAGQLNERQEAPVTPADVEAAYRHISERLAIIEQRKAAKRAGFWVQVPILRPATVAALARPLARIFHPASAFFLIGMVVVTITLFFARHHLLFRFSGASFWIGYILFVLSLVAHELGHASACTRYGAPPGEIGFTTYWIYPAFYSDVSSAWRLKRWQRVVVDLGGVFFQLGVGAIYGLTYMVTGWEPARVAVYMILYNAIFSLNPVLKFDGYWIVSDALGVLNLARQPRRIARHVWDRLRNQSPAPLPWPTWVIRVLAGYSVVSFVFWGYFLWRLLPFVRATVVGYPALVSRLVQNSSEPLMPRLLSALMATFVTSIALLMLVNMARRLLGPLIARCRLFEVLGLPRSWFDRAGPAEPGC